MEGSANSVTLGELARLCDGTLRGDEEYVIDGVSTLTDASSSQLATLSNRKYQCDLSATKAGCVVLREEDSEGVKGNLILHSNPGLAFARIIAFFHPVKTVSEGIAESAVIDPAAEIAPGVEIGALCKIGANVTIGENVSIGPGCVILNGARVGAGSRLVANVTLCHTVTIGQSCLVHPGAVIGSDGFGFANDSGEWVKVPQIGSVIIGDNVEIGANTTIDRGSMRDTIIGDGVKLDNQIQIAHNVVIGDHTAIAALVGIAGSTTIGRPCTIGGEAGVIGHLDIGDRCHIAAQTLVTRSLADDSHYSGGLPAVPTRLWRRMVARLRHIDELFDRVNAIEKQR